MKIVELKLDLKKEAGITAISLVELPATEEDFLTFSKKIPKIDESDKMMEFSVVSEEKMIIMGAAMVPEKLIPRLDQEDGETYFVFFTADTIRQLSEKFFLDGNINSATLEHMNTLNGLTVVESWIVVDSEKDKSHAFGLEYPVGTWVISMKVQNPTVWEQIKSKKVKGFSVEGIFMNQLIKNKMEIDTQKFADILVEKLKGIFTVEKPEKEKFGSIGAVAVVDGSEIAVLFEGEVLELGAPIYHEVDGEQLPVPTGEYTLENGMTLVVLEEGMVGELKEKEEEDMDQEIDIDQLLTSVTELIASALAEMKTNMEAQMSTTLNEFREEFNQPAVPPVVKTPPQKKENFERKTLKQKIADRLEEKQKAGK